MGHDDEDRAGNRDCADDWRHEYCIVAWNAKAEAGKEGSQLKASASNFAR